MSEDSNWVGVVPDPPHSLNGSLSEQGDIEFSCVQAGHDYEHIMNLSGELLMILCGQCERSWAVTER